MTPQDIIRLCDIFKARCAAEYTDGLTHEMCQLLYDSILQMTDEKRDQIQKEMQETKQAIDSIINTIKTTNNETND